MAGKVVEICKKEICPIIENLGYEVVEIEYAKKVDGMNLSFYIDKADGILMEDCEKVSRAIDEPLETVNPTSDEQYILNVSSVGLDRPIKTMKDYLRNKDSEVEVSLYVNVDGKKKFKGKIVNWTDTNIELALSNNQILTFEHEKIGNIVPVIKF